jgi:hypothetical protein
MTGGTIERAERAIGVADVGVVYGALDRIADNLIGVLFIPHLGGGGSQFRQFTPV